MMLTHSSPLHHFVPCLGRTEKISNMKPCSVRMTPELSNDSLSLFPDFQQQLSVLNRLGYISVYGVETCGIMSTHVTVGCAIRMNSWCAVQHLPAHGRPQGSIERCTTRDLDEVFLVVRTVAWAIVIGNAYVRYTMRAVTTVIKFAANNCRSH